MSMMATSGRTWRMASISERMRVSLKKVDRMCSCAAAMPATKDAIEANRREVGIFGEDAGKARPVAAVPGGALGSDQVSQGAFFVFDHMHHQICIANNLVLYWTG